MRGSVAIAALAGFSLGCGSTAAGTFCERYSAYAQRHSDCVRWNIVDGGTGIMGCETAYASDSCLNEDRAALTAWQTCLDKAGACFRSSTGGCAEDAGLVTNDCTSLVFSAFD